MLRIALLLYFTVTVSVVYGQTPQAPTPPQAPPAREYVRVEVKVVKSCPCSSQCVCGCNEGQSCSCGAPRAVSPAYYQPQRYDYVAPRQYYAPTYAVPQQRYYAAPRYSTPAPIFSGPIASAVRGRSC